MHCSTVRRPTARASCSLSKGFGLIQRFSEDIDITVFREDIGQDASVEALTPSPSPAS